MGHTAITQMIIHPTATAALLLYRVADTLHITIVVVRPYDGDVIRYTQTGVVDVESLLIGYKYLR